MKLCTRFLPLLFAALLPLLGGCAKQAAAPTDTLRFGYFGSTPTGTTAWALKQGFLQAELAKVGIHHIVLYSGGTGPQLNEAFAAGAVDVFITGDTPGIIGKAHGLKMHLINVDVSNGDNALIVRPDGPQSVAELVGKKIPVSQGTNGMHYVYGVLTEAGILDKVQILSLDAGAIEAALRRGDIDAASTQTPAVMVAKGFRVIDQARDHKNLLANSPIMAGDDFLAAHPGLVTAWNRARAEAIADMAAHPDAFYDWLAVNVKFPRELLPETYPIAHFNPEPVTPDAIEGLNSLEQFLVDQQIVKHPFPITDWIAAEARPTAAAASAESTSAPLAAAPGAP